MGGEIGQIYHFSRRGILAVAQLLSKVVKATDFGVVTDDVGQPER